MAGIKIGIPRQNLSALNRAFEAIATGVATRARKEAHLAGGQVILDQARENIRATFINRTGALEKSGHIEIGFRASFAEVVFDIVYAAVHEYGLPNQPITDRQRAFFWAMWYQEHDEMWKALALSETYTIPARPYLRPAVDETRAEVAEAAAEAYRRELKRHRRR